MTADTAFTIQEVSRHSGLTEPTLRYYEDVGLIGPIERDESSGHRRYSAGDLDTVEVLACLRAVGLGIGDMRAYLANRRVGRARAAEQRDLLLRHAERVEAEIAAQQARLDYLREKAVLWDARDRSDAVAEAESTERMVAVMQRLEAVR
jgi:MerR family transcriptional regulator, copper efflux regulator